MGKILDLSVFKEETLDITMPDGRILYIRKPSQEMVIKMLAMKDINENSSPETIINGLNALTLAIINSNNAGIVHKVKIVEEMPLRMKLAIINAYSEFITELQSNPN